MGFFARAAVWVEETYYHLRVIDICETYNDEKAAVKLANLGPGSLAQLQRTLHDGRFWEQRKAALALGKINDPMLVPMLIKAYESASYEQKLKIVEALGKMDINVVVEPLLEAYWDFQTDKLVHDKAMEILMEKRPVPKLLRIMNREGEHKMGRHWWPAADILAHMNHPAAIDLLCNCLYNFAIRGCASEILAKAGIREALPDLFEVLDDHDELRRRETGRAIVKISMDGKGNIDLEKIKQAMQRAGPTNHGIRREMAGYYLGVANVVRERKGRIEMPKLKARPGSRIFRERRIFA